MHIFIVDRHARLGARLWFNATRTTRIAKAAAVAEYQRLQNFMLAINVENDITLKNCKQNESSCSPKECLHCKHNTHTYTQSRKPI